MRKLTKPARQSRPDMALAQHLVLGAIGDLMKAQPIEAIRYLVGVRDRIIITGLDPVTESKGGILCPSIFLPALGPGQKYHG